MDATSVTWPLRPSTVEPKDSRRGRKLFSRPIPIRTRTFSQSSTVEASPDERRTSRSHHKSITINEAFSPKSAIRSPSIADYESPRNSSDYSAEATSDILITGSAPSTPSTVMTDISSTRTSLDTDRLDITPYDFSRVDYELERAQVLGKGLWSCVYLAEHKTPESTGRPQSMTDPLRSRNRSGPSLFAVKTPSRRDAKDVFHREAKVLTWLQRREVARAHVVPFYGLDSRNDSLIFEAVIGGSLENLTSRLKQMTELARHLELVSLFPSLAKDLISGLEFLHETGVIHADIKPANILLDISHHQPHSSREDGAPFIRARYIDFSAAFIPSCSADPHLASPSSAGGTWEFMAPEQLRIQADLNTPTFASDIWSLGVTLLAVLIGESPYAGVVAPGNLFMLREAIKSGDPLGFARGDPVARKRLVACQDFVDCLRMALKKDRSIRVTAAGWMRWVEDNEWGLR